MENLIDLIRLFVDPNTPARCIETRNGYVRVLTLNEFKDFFDKKVFKTGPSIAGSSTEFMLDFEKNEYLSIHSDGTKKLRKFKGFDPLTICFNRGSGPCVDGGFVLTDADSNPTTGILKDTFVIWERREKRQQIN